jgi:hypothetical protein
MELIIKFIILMEFCLSFYGVLIRHTPFLLHSKSKALYGNYSKIYVVLFERLIQLGTQKKT